MKPLFHFRPFLSSLLVVWCCTTVLHAQTEPEQQLIQTLLSTASPQEKDAACQKLKVIGTAQCIPALETLLTNDHLSHSARYVLESLPGPEAGAALIRALTKTTGQTQLGIVCSLGARGELRSVPALSTLAKGQNLELSVAATEALGRMGSAQAFRTLRALATDQRGPVHDAAVEGLLRYAGKLLATRHLSSAQGVYRKLYETESDPAVRLAAYRGLIRASGPKGLELVTKALAEGPGPAQLAALQMVRDVQSRGATVALANLLPKLEVPLQVSLAENLGQRGDSAASAPLVGFIPSATPEVRVAILHALRQIGDASAVLVVAQFAASGDPAEQAAARLALLELRKGDVSAAMAEQLASSGADVQAELAKALGERGDTSALPKLFELARLGPASTKRAALKALGLLAGQDQLTELVRLIHSSSEPDTRDAAAEALNVASQRIAARQRSLNVSPLVAGATTGTKEGRIAVYPVLSGLVHQEVRICLRRAAQDSDPEIAAAASRAMCETVDPELIDDVVNLAKEAKDEKWRTLAISGAVRLLTEEGAGRISAGQKIALFRTLLGTAARPQEKKLVLAGIAGMPDLEALQAIEPMLQDETLRNEAARAAISIASTLSGSQAREAMKILQTVEGTPVDEATRQALQGTLKQMQDRFDYLTDWFVAGPFRQEGKDYAALFDIVFPPEKAGGSGIEWRPLRAGIDPQKPFVMDLLTAVGGQQCVAYVRTWVNCEKDLDALMELGTDDGVKVWVNDQQVYALNTARPLQPGSDKVNLKFHSGWNMLLMKITQNNMGWEFCGRLLAPDGSHLEGVRVEAAPKTTSASTP